MLKRISFVALAVSICSFSYSTDVMAESTVTEPLTFSNVSLSYIPPAQKIYSLTPILPNALCKTATEDDLSNKSKYEKSLLVDWQRHKHVRLNNCPFNG